MTFPNGEGGIRTRGKNKSYTAFPRLLDKPLRHLSGVGGKYSKPIAVMQSESYFAFHRVPVKIFGQSF